MSSKPAPNQPTTRNSNNTDALTSVLTKLDARLLELAGHAQDTNSSPMSIWALADSPLLTPSLTAHSDPDASSSLPTAKQLLKLLDQQAGLAASTNSAANSTPAQLQLQTIFQAKLAVVSRELLSQLLIRAAVLPITKDVLYYNQLEADRMWRLFYFAQTVPSRCWSYGSALMKSTTRHSSFFQGIRESGDLFLDSMFPAGIKMRTGVDSSGASSGKSSLLGFGRRIMGPDLVRAEVRLKRAKLEATRELLATCIGFLARPEEGDREPERIKEDALEACRRVLEVLDKALVGQVGIGTSDKLFEELASDLEARSGFSADSSSSSSTPVLDLRTLLNTLHTLPSRLSHSLQPVSQPSFITRWWLPILICSIFLMSLRQRTLANWDDLVSLTTSIKDTFYDFLDTWLVKPLSSVWNTLQRSDDGLGVMNNAENSLKSDLDSLERMVVSFAKDQGENEEVVGMVGEMARKGDLSVVQRAYEEEMKRPVRNAVVGGLVRTLLIQIQKSKVDAEIALASMDKLIQQQQLNFVLLGAIPSLSLLYLLFAWLQSVRKESAVLGKEESGKLLRSAVREAEMLLNRLSNTQVSDVSYRDSGMLRIQAFVILSRRFVVSGELRESFAEDVKELMDSGLEVGQKMRVLERMRWCYPPLWSVAR